MPKYPAPPVAGRPISRGHGARAHPPARGGGASTGTGKSAAIAGYRVAGKTGTAQIPVRGGYRGYLPSFVGFAPADRPALVGLVAIAEPQGSEYYGAQVAAPAFGAIARQVLLYRGVHPERDRPSRLDGADRRCWQDCRRACRRVPAARRPFPRSATDDVLADGDDHAVAVDTAGSPSCDHAAPPTPLPKGGRPHAPL